MLFILFLIALQSTVVIANEKECDNPDASASMIEDSIPSLHYSSDEKDNDVQPAMEDEIFFFQNDEIHSNAIKSVLTLHDAKRMVKGDQQLMESVAAMAVSGGFPCFEKNLPIVEATGDRYILGKAKGLES